MNERETRVKTILSGLLGRAVADLSATTRLKDDLGVDSTEMVEIVCVVEKAFGVKLAPDSDKTFKTVGDLYRAVPL